MGENNYSCIKHCHFIGLSTNSGFVVIDCYYLYKIKIGKLVTFDSNGNVISEGLFASGKKVGYWKEWDLKKQVYFHGKYNNRKKLVRGINIIISIK